MRSKVFKISLIVAPILIAAALVLYYAPKIDVFSILTSFGSKSNSSQETGQKAPVVSKNGLTDTEGSSGKPTDTKKSPQDYFLTAKEVSAMENISILDKLAGFTLLYKVSNSDMDRIMGMLNNGLTYAEYESVKAILQNYLNERELQQLNDLLEKNKALYITGKLAAN